MRGLLRVSRVALLAAALGGCYRAAQPAHSDSAGGRIAVAEGVLYVAGSEPGTMVMLRPDSGTALLLHGRLVSELRRISGARVEVRGPPDSLGPSKGITVSEYDMLAIDGRRPSVGLLASTDGALWLRGTDSLQLADATGRLRPLVGGKIWVLADTSVSPALVQSYGVLREPNP